MKAIRIRNMTLSLQSPGFGLCNFPFSNVFEVRDILSADANDRTKNIFSVTSQVYLLQVQHKLVCCSLKK